MDCSLPGSSVHGILQARVLEWVAILFSMGIFLIQGSNPSFLQAASLPSEPPGRPVLLLFSGSPSRSLNLSSGSISTQHKPHAICRKNTLCLSECLSPQQPIDSPEGKKNPGILSQHELIPPLTPALSFQSPGIQLWSCIGTPITIPKGERSRVWSLSHPCLWHRDLSFTYIFNCQRISENRLYARH